MDFFTEITYSLYKYVDVKIPPGPDEEILRINYEDNFFHIRFKNSYYESNLENLDKTFSEIFETYPRSIFIVPNNFTIKTEEIDRTSAFLSWNKEITLPLKKDGIVYTYTFTPPIGERIINIPYRTIELKIQGSTEKIILNGIEVLVPQTLIIPPTKLEIINQLETFEIDLTYYFENEYILDLEKKYIYKTLHTEIIHAYEIESGIFLKGVPYSIWVPQAGEPIVTNSRFYSDYGDIEKRDRTFKVNGEIIFVHEYDDTLYMFTSSGQFITMGKKHINSDFGRSPMNIQLFNNYIEVTTFKYETYRINYNGGISKQPRKFDIEFNLTFNQFKEKYETNLYFIDVKKDRIDIYLNE
jgi:hypothetical protein